MKINNRKTSMLICPICNKEYYKTNSEIKRNLKLNRPNFCSLACAGKHQMSYREDIKQYLHSEENMSHLKKLNSASKEKAMFSFSYYLRNAVRDRKEVTIDKEYLKQLWEDQNGTCPYTNIQLKLKSMGEPIDPNNPFVHASLDRIDSSKGYVPGNVEFISVGINLLKNKFSKNSVINFLNHIKLQDALAGN